MMRRTATAIAVIGLLGTSSARAGSPGEPTVEVRVIVTLSGPVDPDHTFAVFRSCESGTCLIDSATLVCSPTHPYAFMGICKARVYELRWQVSPGDELDYALWRVKDKAQGDLEEFLPGTVIVPAAGITLSLGFDYALGSTPSPALPDTAMATP